MRYRQLPLEQIAVTDRNIRKTCSEEGMAELAASIERFGLLQPLVVFQIGEDEYELVAGGRRMAACVALDWKTIPAMVTKSEEQAGFLAQAQENLVREDMSVAEEMDVLSAAMQLTENVQREGLGEADEAEALLTIAGGRNPQGRPSTNREKGPSRTFPIADLAILVGKSKTWVKRRLLLLDLPEDVRGRVRKQDPGSGEKDGLAINTAATIARLSGDEDTQRKLAEKVECEQMTAPQVEQAVRAIKRDPEQTDAILAASTDDSSFDILTTRERDKTPVKPMPPPPDTKPAEVVIRRVSQAYLHLLVAFDEDRIEQVSTGDKPAFGEARVEIAEKACYMRALLDRVIGDWRLDELCDWTDEPATDAEGIRARVTSLELIS